MFKYLKKYWFFALLAPLFMVGEVMMDLLQPKMMSVIVDDGVLGLNNGNVGDLDIVLSSGLQMIGVVFLGAFSELCPVCLQISAARTSEMISARTAFKRLCLCRWSRQISFLRAL